MARISNGNALTSGILQPGWKTQTDGYGLITSQCNFKIDGATGDFAICLRGASHPSSSYSYCKAHKNSITWDSLGVANVVVDYVGIDPSVNSGTRTNPQITGTQNLTAEHVSTHPNFFNTAAGYSSPIADSPPYTASDLGPSVNGTSSFVGSNGACFEKADGGRFIGFVDPGYPDYYGKTQYLAPTSTISGFFYTTSTTNITELRNRVGKTSGTNTFYSIPLIPSYIGTVFTNGSKNQMLLSQIGFEDFGSLYKVTYEIRYNREGYNRLTYLDA